MRISHFSQYDKTEKSRGYNSIDCNIKDTVKNDIMNLNVQTIVFIKIKKLK